jgi:hypothetical protein
MKTIGLCLLLAAASVTACGGDDDPALPDASIADATPPVTYANFAQGFFETYCYDCHGAGDALRDYTMLSMIRAEQDKIRCGVSPTALTNCSIAAEMFPVGSGPKPTREERLELVRWIDEGAVD